MDLSVLDTQGARPPKPSKYTSLCTLKFIGGLQTQRSPFASIDNRYNTRYLSGKPDALIAGSNIELSNRLTLQRRPGLLPYGPSIPAPSFFYSWQQATLANFVATVDPTGVIYPDANLQFIVDTYTPGPSTPDSIYNYSPQAAGVILNKSTTQQNQTSFYTIVNTMYLGDGVDLYKVVGINLLTQSNNFGSAPWSTLGATLTTGQTDPTGGTNATQAVFSTFGSSTAAYILQHVTPNYTPVSENTFTFSVWLKSNTPGAQIFLEMTDSTGAIIVNTQQTLTTSWALYQVTGQASVGATSVAVLINDPNSATADYFIYGAQLEVGGPATPTTITLNKPNGVYLWGIQAPTVAPTFTFTQQNGSTGKPWQQSHLYSQTSVTITSVDAASGGVAVYHGTITGGAANALVGRYVSVLGFSNAQNNSTAPGFVVTASTATTITVTNPSAVAEIHTTTMTLLDTIVDSNGNLEVAYTPGKSGGTQPVWSPVQGNPTQDGLQNLIVQTNTNSSPNASVSVTLGANVTGGNTLLIFILSYTAGSVSLTDSAGDTPTLVTSASFPGKAGLFEGYLYWVKSATAGATTISLTGGGTNGTWIGVAEMEPQSATDGTASNTSKNGASPFFLTGSVSTTNEPDIFVTFAAFINQQSGFQLGNIPAGYQSILNLSQSPVPSNFWNANAAFQVLLTEPVSQNPQWTITNVDLRNGMLGFTVAFKSSVGTLVWYNVGQSAVTGLSPKTGYQYLISFVNTYTGHRSNVGVLSATTGVQTGVGINVSTSGMQTLNSGPPDADPQVDALEAYRNTDGGGFWYQIPPALLTNLMINGQPANLLTVNGVSYLPNPGTATSAGTISFTDVVLDEQLNTQIYAPIGFLNSPPPAGLMNLEFFDGRLWGSVGSLLYYATAPDNATLLNVLQNGVSPESWEPTNYIPFNSPIVRSVAVASGLLVFTTTDVWIIQGNNLANYNPTKQFAGVGIGTYNAVCIDGSTLWMYTRDRQCLMMNSNSGVMEIGFLIGDLIETQMNPTKVYLARHIKGSQDNAFYFADGSTGWFRLNPNQYGASASGEQTPIWSPFASIVGGLGAVGSVEVQPGVKLLLCGQTSAGPILYRDISTFSDNGNLYTWSATVGSIMLALPGKIAGIESITTEMTAATSTQCGVGVLIDEITGSFETLTNPTNDPPQLVASQSVLSNRFYLSAPGTLPPIGRHCQVQLTGSAVATRDELLALTIRGDLQEEQS